MMLSERYSKALGSAPTEASARLLAEFKKATLRNDPTAVFQAIILCSDHEIALPTWLSDHLLKLIADYHLGKKPSWKGAGNRPLIIIRRRFENEVKRRAVIAVRAWVRDKTKYQAMPTKCIHAWNRQDYRHCEIKNDADALDFASFGLQGVKLQVDGPTLKCSPRTLRRAIKDQNMNGPPKLSGRIASVFGLTDPDSLFGFEHALKPNLK